MAERPAQRQAGDREISQATGEDVTSVVEAISQLLVELGGSPPPRAAMESSAHELLSDHTSGLVLLARVDDAVVGLVAASWQTAIHAGGRYGLIQDLWVSPDWRGRSVGAELLAELFAQAGMLGITRIEVGLPPEHFPALAATQAFYRANGFTLVGTRMRTAIG